MNELKGLTFLFTKDITQQAKVVRGNEYRTLQKNLSPYAQLTDLIIHLITMLLGVLNCDQATFRLKATNSQQFLFYFNIL